MGFSTMAKPLTSLTRKGNPWKWGEPKNQAFEEIKGAFLQQLVLVHPDPTKPYFLETDASGVAMGAILSQQQEDR